MPKPTAASRPSRARKTVAPAAPAVTTAPERADIERLAYTLWEQNGRQSDAEADWLEAERRLSSSAPQAPQAPQRPAPRRTKKTPAADDARDS